VYRLGVLWLTALVMAFCGPLLPLSEVAVKADSLSWVSPEVVAVQLPLAAEALDVTA
jgi:hypothetical protein